MSIAIPGVDVVIRGLTLDGVGDGASGISMTAGRSLSVEHSVLANFVGHGLVVRAAAVGLITPVPPM